MVGEDIKAEITEMLDKFDQKDLTEIHTFLKQKEKEKEAGAIKLSDFAEKIIEQEHTLLKRLAE